MLPVHFAGVTRIVPALPAGDDGDPHLELPVADDGFKTESVWAPSPEELAVLNSGGGVKLQFRGSVHPAVAVIVAEPHELAA